MQSPQCHNHMACMQQCMPKRGAHDNAHFHFQRGCRGGTSQVWKLLYFACAEIQNNGLLTCQFLDHRTKLDEGYEIIHLNIQVPPPPHGRWELRRCAAPLPITGQWWEAHVIFECCKNFIWQFCQQGWHQGSQILLLQVYQEVLLHICQVEEPSRSRAARPRQVSLPL